ncbi:FAD-binding dehydrogenase [Kineosporia mesophila]|uniref:FAD-binding dehydrogenase n=1 Tax=Kineosporia mesophila TaxID=566012 RepID=A0ABP6Z2L8_9ACTN|nr:FAD-binding dehydrogenase [Kineosporia mesophila]MCD5353556.1 FAD-binding dehydrogenase [Kineosporia mesophila]
MDADVIVVGAGLAGLVATAELVDAGRRVILVDQESDQNVGGQAHWSFGGLFLVDSPEQRRMKIRDSHELAWQDWQDTAGFDRDEDHWPRRWAEAYVDFAAGEKRSWLSQRGLTWFPLVGWPERGEGRPGGIGNTVPRFHITWGTGPGVVEPFERRVREAVALGQVTLALRHRVDDLVVRDGAVTGVTGQRLEADRRPRGVSGNHREAGEFSFSAEAVIVTSGGIGGSHDRVREVWPQRLGTAPSTMVAGVPAHVDGRMIPITQRAGGSVINPDRMWHYTEGLHNWDEIWPGHGIRILPGPSSLWLDATGHRLPAHLYPGADTLGTLEYLRTTGHDHSWFVLNQKIVEKEFTLSGSEQNPDLTGKSLRQLLGRVKPGPTRPVQDFLDNGKDFVIADNLPDLVRAMNETTAQPLLDLADVEAAVLERDRQIVDPSSTDDQILAIRDLRSYFGYRLIRTAGERRLLDPKAGPLIAVRLSVLTRKTLGGLQTDLDSRVLTEAGDPVPGLYAAGECAGFGGGGMHGYRALEGTFLGGCIFSGRTAGRSAAEATRA